MKVFYNSKIAKVFTFLADFATIMLFGAVFTEHDSLSERCQHHEAVHVTQYQTMFMLGLLIAFGVFFACLGFDVYGWWMLTLILIPISLYYVWYLVEYLVRLIMYRDSGKAYRMIAFEQEAYDLEYEYLKPCPERRIAYSFSFLRYY